MEPSPYSAFEEGTSLPSPSKQRWWLHLLLFVLTFVTTTVAGVLWTFPEVAFDLEYLSIGLPYSISVLFILTAHEFGHYFAARAHHVDSTLPYYIPFPTFPPFHLLFLNFGTFGAIIRTRSVVPSRKALFDIGVAGPIAGFVASAGILIYGFQNLPPQDYLLTIHPDYDFLTNSIKGSDGLGLAFGNTLLYAGLENLFVPAGSYLPPLSEVYHYPYLCAGWFGMFVTALNLIPMGQFDGGHTIYAMFGEAHKRIAHVAFYVLLALSAPSITDSVLRVLLSWVTGLDQPQIVPLAEYSWSAWFVWALVALYIVKLYHPPVPDERPLDPIRRSIGWLTLAIFVLCFSPNPIIVTVPT